MIINPFRFAAGGPFSPSDIAGLKLWLKADAITGLSDGDPVTTWEDASSANNDATQGTANVKPLYKTAIVNSLPVVRFVPEIGNPPLSDYLSLPDFMNAQTAATVFWVAKITTDPPATDPRTGPPVGDLGTDANADHYPYTDSTVYLDIGSTVRKTVGNPTPSLTSWHYVSIVSASADWRFYLAGTSIFATGTNTVAFNSAPLVGRASGAGGPYGFDGDIAEIIVYNSALSDTDRGNVQTYLASKYGL